MELYSMLSRNNSWVQTIGGLSTLVYLLLCTMPPSNYVGISGPKRDQHISSTPHVTERIINGQLRRKHHGIEIYQKAGKNQSRRGREMGIEQGVRAR